MRFPLAALVLFALANSASASIQLLSPVSNPIGGFNDFAGYLTGLQLVTGNVEASPGTLSFYAHGAESGYNNAFSIQKPDASGSLSFSENADFNWFASPFLIGSFDVFVTTKLSDLLAKFTSNVGPTASLNVNPGFGIFAEPLQGGGFKTTYNELFFGYDDDGAGPDDNHDDLIVSVSYKPFPPPQGTPPSAPEPMSFLVWGGLAGVALLIPAVSRRR